MVGGWRKTRRRKRLENSASLETWKTERSERLEKQKLSENLEPGKLRGKDWKAK